MSQVQTYLKLSFSIPHLSVLEPRVNHILLKALDHSERCGNIYIGWFYLAAQVLRKQTDTQHVWHPLPCKEQSDLCACFSQGTLLWYPEVASLLMPPYTADEALWSSPLNSPSFKTERKRKEDRKKGEKIWKAAFNKLLCKVDIHLKLCHYAKEISCFWQVSVINARSHSKYH